MGYCLTHNQNYDERNGGFCYQCRDAANIKVVSTTSTNSAMVEIALVLRDLVIASTEGVEQRTADFLLARLNAVITRLPQ